MHASFYKENIVTEPPYNLKTLNQLLKQQEVTLTKGKDKHDYQDWK
jgi:hypothetical protein